MAAIFCAIRDRRLHQAKLLIQIGADVNAKHSHRRFTALMELCNVEDEARAAKLAKVLLEYGARLDSQDSQGMTALCYAAKLGREQLVSVMMEEVHAFDVNAADKLGNTALHYAALSGNFVVLNLLLKTLKKYDISIDMVNLKGETPLICAAKAGNFLCSRILISQGKASTQARDKELFKSASEWECTPQSRRLASRSALFRSSLVSVPRLSITNTQRPQTAPEKLGTNNGDGPERNSRTHRDNLRDLYRVYQHQLSGAYRLSVKPRPSRDPVMEPQDVFDPWGTCELDLSSSASSMSSCPITPRRYSVSKTAKLAVNTNHLIRRRSVATSGLPNVKPTMNRRMSTMSRPSISGRKLSQSLPSSALSGQKYMRRNSINVIANVSVSLKQGARKGFNKGKGSALTIPQSDLLMDKLNTLKEASDDDDDDDDTSDICILQRSSPGLLMTVMDE